MFFYFQKLPVASGGGGKDSDSNCSVDLSNTDSGRGSNDDNTDNHFRTQSPPGGVT